MNMKNRITFPRVEGKASRQAHAGLPEGTYEREFGREGFFGPATHLYHSHPPTGWLHWEGPLRPRAFDLAEIEGHPACPWEATPILRNRDADIRFWRITGAMDHLVRNADGDELVFIHAGQGDLFCDFSHLRFAEGDYIVLPRGTTWRMEARKPVAALLVEATNGAYGLPDKGIVGEHAIFDPAILDVPALDEAFRDQQSGDAGEQEWSILIKRGNLLSTVTYPFNPLDAVGWKGDLLPVRLNWRDIRPVMSHAYHIPPSAHTTFTAGHFIVCTFVPRPTETAPDALKLPFFHSNNDYDEVIFYHRGQFISRDNIHPGMLTWHPCGFPHGPHPKAFDTAAKAGRKETDEVAVMIDTRAPLEASPEAEGLEVEDYAISWRRPEAGT